MNATTTLIETRLATMERVAPGLIVQRFRSGVKLDREGFEENRVARHTLAEDRPHAMLSVFPEGIDFDLAVTTHDHFKPEKEKLQLVALAVVAHDTLAGTVVQLFFSYFPQVFTHAIFENEAEALSWLRAQLPG
ncbi:MAG: hypothetical protein IT229_03515 [Flavobacteriales bacterium]|nr:hypothetical protein [Flavobacteriales bacterium]